MTTIDAPGTAAGPRAPQPVRIAVASVLTGVVLHVVRLVAQLVDRPTRAELRHVPNVTPGLLTTTTVLSVVVTVVICALGVFFAVKMRGGANWARVTLTVLGALELLGVVFSLVGGLAVVMGGGLTIVIQVLIGLAVIAFLATAYLRPAGEFFARGGRPS